MTKSKVKPLTTEDISEALRHFRKIVLEGKKPTNNLQMIDINLIVLKLKSLRKHSKKQLQKLKNAINKVGYVNPVLLDEKHNIMAGELRLLAAKELGFTQIPAIILENLTEEEVEAIRILDNRIAEDGEWNYENLKDELEKLLKFDISFEDLGFDTVDYDKIFLADDIDENKVHDSDKEDESWLDANIPPKVKFGDLWRLGDHFVYCGDSLLVRSFEILMQGELAQIVITDPPYNCKIKGHVCGLGKTQHEEFAMASGEMTDAEFAEFISKFIQNLIKFSVDGSLHYMFMDWAGLNILLTAGKKYYTELKNIAIWNKGVGGMGAMYRSQHEMVPIFKNGKAKHQNHIQLGKYGRYRTNVWDYPGVRATNPASLELLKLHPTCKNVCMLHSILLDASSKNDIVLDCFGGSGSTLLAAERCKRRARLIEISPRYVDVTIFRWEKETGKTAKLIKNIVEVQHGE
ncbi:TPA: ParB N-terminal domain-containing protein [Candidatus Scatenecus faecavium]|uniref:ParB N-terminal domain-containing protein n=1 Tax=Candidatus Scatenecus faecavium TaxID=2840915 RepID=A0A9D1K2Y3_9BACT|nr:ParB N-terminal domain-containing protein [Candidatus Scatenecus faecavium]